MPSEHAIDAHLTANALVEQCLLADDDTLYNLIAGLDDTHELHLVVHVLSRRAASSLRDYLGQEGALAHVGAWRRKLQAGRL
jgi:hypothetical protein